MLAFVLHLLNVVVVVVFNNLFINWVVWIFDFTEYQITLNILTVLSTLILL